MRAVVAIGRRAVRGVYEQVAVALAQLVGERREAVQLALEVVVTRLVRGGKVRHHAAQGQPVRGLDRLRHAQ